MAVVTRKSTAISNRDAVPMVPTNADVGGALAKLATGYVTATNGDSANSLYPLISLPSNARVHSLKTRCDALGTSAAMNVGVFWPTTVPPLAPGVSFGTVAAAGAVGTNGATFFASALDVHAALAETDILNQSTNNPIATQEQELWQALGLTQDPNCMFDICGQVSVAMAATGKFQVMCTYAT